MLYRSQYAFIWKYKATPDNYFNYKNFSLENMSNSAYYFLQPEDSKPLAIYYIFYGIIIKMYEEAYNFLIPN